MALFPMLGLIGCAEKTETRALNEAEVFAMSVLNQRFIERDGRWSALETKTAAGKFRLIELNKPFIQLQPLKVTDTDRMNGVTHRYTVSVSCEQFRYWDNTWTEWKAGTGGPQHGLAHALTMGMLGYQRYTLKKKNGDGWSRTPSLPRSRGIESKYSKRSPRPTPAPGSNRVPRTTLSCADRHRPLHRNSTANGLLTLRSADAITYRFQDISSCRHDRPTRPRSLAFSPRS